MGRSLVPRLAGLESSKVRLGRGLKWPRVPLNDGGFLGRRSPSTEINVLEQSSHLRQDHSCIAQISGASHASLRPLHWLHHGHVFCRTMKDVSLAGSLEQFLKADEDTGELVGQGSILNIRDVVALTMADTLASDGYKRTSP